MFTGIIKSLGTIKSMEAAASGKKFAIDAGTLDQSALALGNSIAINGVCLTVTSSHKSIFQADVSAETLDKTTLGDLQVDAEVNLEPALCVGDSLGGHFVSGHVDDVGKITALKPDGESMRVSIEVPVSLTPYIAMKGSIVIDGISLTVNSVEGNIAGINIVPHTMKMTTLKSARSGQHVNIEVDLIARYLARLVEERL